MDWLLKMNEAVSYIEENLAGEIDNKVAADILHCSIYHFQKVFAMMSGIPLSEYIRRRRLSLAAGELQSTDIKVLDLALKYGYNSPTAFNRAFQNMQGVSPNEARKKGVQLKAYPPIAFQISIKGAVEMNYRIEERDAFRIVGDKVHTTMENEAGFQEIPKFWGKSTQEGLAPRLCEIMNQEPMGIMGMSVFSYDSKSPEFDYYIAVSSDKAVPKGLYEYEVPASTWAIFECIGPMPHTIQDMSKRIMTEWFPSSGYEYGGAPDIELYTDGDTQAADYRTEIWVSVKKK